MARIVTGNVDAYVKQLLSDEFDHGTNGDKHQQKHIHIDGKEDPRLSRSILGGRIELDGKEA